MDYYDGNHGDGRWLVMGLMMLLLWGLLIAFVVWVVRSTRGPAPHPDSSGGTSSKANALLAERFARGEIDEEEFRRRRDLLHEASGSP